MNDLTPQEARQAALEEVENLKLIRAAAWEEHSSSFKWLMASLLAVNGGALLSVYDSQSLSLETTFYASTFFVLGLTAALLIAVFGQQAVQKSIGPLQQMIGYWLAVADDGERVASMEKDLASKFRVASKAAILGRLCGWISALAFLAGSAVIGVELKSTMDSPIEPIVLPQS